MDNEGKCGHDMCGCRVPGEAEYCGDHCRDAVDQDMVEISCDCGHTGCG